MHDIKRADELMGVASRAQHSVGQFSDRNQRGQMYT